MRFIGWILFFFSIQTQAATLGPNDIYISGEVVSVSPLCPEGANCFVDGTAIQMKFILPSSCYYLSALDYSVSQENKNIEFTIVQSDNSAGKLCTLAAKEEIQTISLVNVYPPFEIYFAGSTKLSFPIYVKEYSK